MLFCERVARALRRQREILKFLSLTLGPIGSISSLLLFSPNSLDTLRKNRRNLCPTLFNSAVYLALLLLRLLVAKEEEEDDDDQVLNLKQKKRRDPECHQLAVAHHYYDLEAHLPLLLLLLLP